MKIGLDLDGTVYRHPEFFAALISAMTAAGHEFYCISTHGLDEWPNDVKRLEELGVPASKISTILLNPQRHIHLHIKGQAASQCDYVFDDDTRLQAYTETPVFAPL